MDWLRLSLVRGVALFGDYGAASCARRQREGIAKAQRDGKYKRRKPTARSQAEKIKALHASNLKAPEIAAQLSISDRSVYRVLQA